MSKLTSNLLNIIDYAHILKIRNNNFERYAKALAPTNLIDARMLNGPFCYPYRIKNGAQIRQSLIEKKIYIPILWPNVTKSYGASDEEFDMAQNTLPLPVGQGVSFEDIDLIIEALQDLHA
jgi:dTDP-4-amino-4,6-dideoxygalactose transaminase